MALALTLALPLPAQADSMRCGKWVVTEEMPPSEILAKCGEPSAKEMKSEDVYDRGVKRGVKVTETWTYHRSRSIPMKVVIVNGKTVSITNAP